MKETKHTPGPWAFDREDMNVYSDIGTGIATIHRQAKVVGVDDLETAGLSVRTKANAKLIAAAPDILKALQYILSNLDGMGIKVANRLQADDAIRKATL